MSHWVICPICGQRFDRDKEPFVKYGARRYAHAACAAKAQEEISKEEKDKLALEAYIMELLNETYINPRVRKQLKQFKEEYNYTDSGMLKALVYFYDIKGNDRTKANGGVGIIPFIYQTAYNYYYSIWEAQQKNVDKVISDYTPEVEEIAIRQPQRKPRKRRLFTFLDGEDK